MSWGRLRGRSLARCAVVAVAAGSLVLAGTGTAGADDIHDRQHAVQSAIASTQISLEAANVTLQKAEQTLTAVQAQLPGAQRAVGAAQRREQLAAAAVSAAQADLAAAKAALAAAQAQLVATQQHYAQQRALMANTARLAFEEGPVSSLDALLAPGTAGDLMDRQGLLSAVVASRQVIVSDLGNARAAVQQTRDLLDRREAAVAQQVVAAQDALGEQQQAVAAATAARAHVTLLVSQRAAALKVARSQVASEQAHMAALEAQSQRIAAIIAAQQAQQARQPQGGGFAGPPVFSNPGGLLWPANGPLVQPYGPSHDPITGASGFHPGIDIGAPYGSPIWAAATGVVSLMLSTYQSGGYGNYTCIDHGGGFTTCYAHQSLFEVSVGEHVVRGQEIGRVGATGYVTGPHLHFETRINGQTVNPMNYF